MSRKKLVLVIASCLAWSLVGNVIARNMSKELRVNLKFIPQEGVASNAPSVSPAVLEQPVTLNVEDGRGPNGGVIIGKGTNDDDQGFPIVATSDVIAHVDHSVKEIAPTWGVKVADTADRVLTLRLSHFFVDESNKALGSVYAAEVRLAFKLTNRAGKTLSEGASSGSAHRYGRARSSDNSNEVLSDALKEAFATVVGNPDLQEAWSTGRTSANPASEAKGKSVEERLRKLDELLEKRLITKEEFNAKRAEILKDI